LVKDVKVSTEKGRSWLPAFPRYSRSAFPGLAALSLFYNPNTLCHPKRKRTRWKY
jgi:hypothetical protein